ncbi:MAG: L-serine ammonia-lyase, iron-sulfur-dependent, subunit alpha [Bacteroidales bacterium]|jgi:L-cysteine desulfidase|nr:L-serine ammonia-lyase, iron-sulfur-dependent, subunit alpha [Bacteroidales bacterium]
MNCKREDEIIKLLRSEVKPAVGCTEPVAVALAVSKACEVLRLKGFDPFEVEVEVSANILKNAMGVGIPGTGKVGLPIAVALAVACGKSEYKLEVLKDVSSEALERAEEFVAAGKIKISVADTQLNLYIKVTVFSSRKGGDYAENGNHYATAVVSGSHDNIESYGFDGVNLSGRDVASPEGSHSSAETKSAGSVRKDDIISGGDITIREICDFVNSVDFDRIEFILESKKLNKALSAEGLRGDYGLKVGKTIAAAEHNMIYGNTVLARAMSATAAATDARMDGCVLPAMSNSGSGNQGITVTMPLVSVADDMNCPREQLARALALAHLVAIHIKSRLGKLSALCGCVVASAGSSCGMVFLKGGGYDQICSAIKNMAGSITGMVCDGAKTGCALKVASGVASAIQSALLALNGISASSNDGIINDDIEKTISDIGAIGSEGMKETDKMILNIMVSKQTAAN